MNPQGTAWSPTLDELLSPQLQVVNKKEDASGTVYAKLADNYRRNENVIEKWCYVLDIDKSPYDVGMMLTEGLQGFQGCFHTTYSHDPKRQMYCYRVILPTDKSVAPDDYETGFLNLVDDNKVLSRLRDESILDMTAKDKGRFYYDFSCPPDREDFAYIHKLNGGTPYIPDTRKRTTANSVSSGEPVVTQRNISLTKEAGRLISLHKHKPTVVREALAFNEKFNPPLDIQEAMTVINSIWKKHFKDNPEDTPITEIPSGRRSYTIEEYRGLPPVEWLVYNLIEDKSMNAIYGASGSTKSFLAIDLGMHLALGMDWFGYEVYKPIPVIYVAVEGGGGLLKRIDGWIKTHNNTTPKNFIIDRDVISPKDEKSVDGFIDFYKDKGFKDGMIIVDTLNANARSSGIDENGPEMGLVVAAFQKINIALNCSYTLVHHTGKDESKGMRGHTSVHASMDTILYVQKKDSGKRWTLEKIKEGEDGITYGYFTDVVETIEDSKGNMQTTLVVRPSVRLEKQEKRINFRGNQKVIWNYVKDYLYPLESKRADVDSLLNAIYERWSEHPTDKRKHDARKVITTLKNYGILETGTFIDPDTKHKEIDQIWITKKGLEY